MYTPPPSLRQPRSGLAPAVRWALLFALLALLELVKLVLPFAQRPERIATMTIAAVVCNLIFGLNGRWWPVLRTLGIALITYFALAALISRFVSATPELILASSGCILSILTLTVISLLERIKGG